MAINTTRLATRLGSSVKQLNEANATNADNRAAMVQALQTHAQEIIIQEVLADRPQTAQTFGACFVEWCRQMALVPDTFSASTCTSTVAAVGSPTGTPKFATSDLDDYGQRGDFLLPDVLVLRATGADTYSIMGKAAIDATAFNWPGGAGVESSGTLIDPDSDSDLLDPSFEEWSGSPLAPDNWEIVAGTAGTTVVRVVEGFLDPSGYCMKLVGDTTSIQVRQDASGLDTGVYIIHAALNAATDTVDTGTVSITLRDESGNVLSATGISQAFSTLVDDTWTPVVASVYVPRQLTDGCYLEIRWTGGTGDELLVDCVSIKAATRLYPNGLALMGFKGVTDMILDTDQWTVTTALDSGTITTRLAKGIDRLVDVANQSARLPTGGSPTQADALIA